MSESGQARLPIGERVAKLEVGLLAVKDVVGLGLQGVKDEVGGLKDQVDDMGQRIEGLTAAVAALTGQGKPPRPTSSSSTPVGSHRSVRTGLMAPLTLREVITFITWATTTLGLWQGLRVEDPPDFDVEQHR